MRDRSLKDEMREALRGDRERAEARRKAAEEGAYVGPAPPTLDLNAPTREWKLPRQAEEAEPAPEQTEEPAQEPEAVAGQETQEERQEEAPEPEAPERQLPPAAAAEPEPPPEQPGLLSRLRSFFRG